MKIGERDVSNDPPQFVINALKDAKMPVTLHFKLNPTWILSQPPCACSAWNELRAAFITERALADQQLAPPSTHASESGGSELNWPPSPSETKKRVEESFVPMVVLETEGLRLFYLPDSQAKQIGRLDFGTIVKVEKGSKRNGFVRITAPFPGWCLKESKRVALLGLASSLRSLESVAAASSLSRTRPLDSERDFEDTGTYLAYWDSIAKHVLTIMARINSGFRIPLAETITEYMREPGSARKYKFKPDFTTGNGVPGDGGDVAEAPRIVVFYSNGVPKSILESFTRELGEYSRAPNLAVDIVNTTGKDLKMSLNIPGARHHCLPQERFEKLGLHKLEGRHVWHMCILDEFGNIVRNTWPLTRVMATVLQQRYKIFGRK